MEFCNKISLKLTHSEKKSFSLKRKYEEISQRIKVEYSVEEGNGDANSPFKLNVKLSNISDKTYKGVLRFELSSQKTGGKIFMPAFMYNRNGGDRGQYSLKACYPHLAKGYKKCFSEYWQVRGDRLSHPMALAYADNYVFGISSSPYYGIEKGKYVFWENKKDTEFAGFNGFYCSVENGTTVGFTLGYENAPYTYVLTPKYDKKTNTDDRFFVIEAGATAEFPLYVYCYKAACENDVSSALENCYYRYHRLPRKRSDMKNAVKDIAGAIFTDAYVAESKNYATVVKLKDGEVVKEVNNISIGWTGGAEIASPLLMAAIRLGDERMRAQALQCIDNIVENFVNVNSGLPFDAYNSKKGWTEKGWWYSGLKVKGHNTYVIAQAVYYILKAYETEKTFKNEIHAQWLGFVEKILDKFLLSQKESGEFPYTFSVKNGKGAEYSGYAGCWCYTAMAYFSFLSGTEKYIESMRKAHEYYHDFVKKEECYGTPADTYMAVDSEGILAFIKACRFMHRITSQNVYLDHLKEALNYEFSFKFAYDSKILVPPLSETGWSSCGGSVTSVCNPHIHPMSNNVIDDMIYYLKIKPDDYIRSRLHDTVLWGLQSYNSYDGEFGYGRKGWMSERFCYSQGLLIEKYPDGKKSSIWFAFLPWGAANVLEGFCGELWQNEDMIL